MLSARSFFFFTSAFALLAVASPALAQETGVPARPESRIHDGGSVFEAGDRPKTAEKITTKLDALRAETGCDILVATVSATTGSSPRALADQYAAAWLNPAEKGAVLVYERAGNRFAISATAPVRETIADYLLASIEQASLDREDAAPAEVVALAAGDLAAVFRKNFGEDAGLDHPSIKADRILFGAVVGCIAVMLALVASLHWRGERARA